MVAEISKGALSWMLLFAIFSACACTGRSRNAIQVTPATMPQTSNITSSSSQSSSSDSPESIGRPSGISADNDTTSGTNIEYPERLSDGKEAVIFWDGSSLSGNDYFTIQRLPNDDGSSVSRTPTNAPAVSSP